MPEHMYEFVIQVRHREQDHAESRCADMRQHLTEWVTSNPVFAGGTTVVSPMKKRPYKKPRAAKRAAGKVSPYFKVIEAEEGVQAPQNGNQKPVRKRTTAWEGAESPT